MSLTRLKLGSSREASFLGSGSAFEAGWRGFIWAEGPSYSALASSNPQNENKKQKDQVCLRKEACIWILCIKCVIFELQNWQNVINLTTEKMITTMFKNAKSTNT